MCTKIYRYLSSNPADRSAKHLTFLEVNMVLANEHVMGRIK